MRVKLGLQGNHSLLKFAVEHQDELARAEQPGLLLVCKHIDLRVLISIQSRLVFTDTFGLTKRREHNIQDSKPFHVDEILKLDPKDAQYYNEL